MLFKVGIELTEAGLGSVEHVAASVYRAVAALQRTTDEQLASSYAEAAQLSRLRFDWRDRTEPLVLARAAAHELHCKWASQHVH